MNFHPCKHLNFHFMKLSKADFKNTPVAFRITREYVPMHITTPGLHYLSFLSGNISTVIVSLLVYIAVCRLKTELLSLFFFLVIEYLLHIFKDQKMDKITQSLY